MLRIFLSSRGILVSVLLVVLVVGGSLFYSWHVRRTSADALLKTDQHLRQFKDKNEKLAEKPATYTVDIETPGFDATPEANTDAPMSDASEALETQTPEIVDAFLSDDFLSEETPVKDVAVSPYGWGPYPEVPVDYPSVVLWEREYTGNLPNDVLKDIELTDRVLVKLWSDGERGFKGGSFDGIKVYPHYHNTVYVRYAFDGDHRYFSRARGGPEIPKLTPDQLYNMDLPEGIHTIDMDTAGIDPYSFLGF